MGSPPIPDRSPPPQSPKRPAGKLTSINFSPPKRRTASLKGKERALEDNSYPAEIQVSYRHLLGKANGGPSNPLRCIAHVDIDAAYAAMEMARLGVDPSVPLAVQQWNGLIAVNYPARVFGITRHESPADALKKCPHLMLVHCATYRQGDLEPGYWGDSPKPETHKISLDHYRRESLRIVKVFTELCPIVEKASMDESYLDVTLPVRAELLRLYPSLATLPDGASPDDPLPSPASLDVHLDWPSVGNLIPKDGQTQAVTVGPSVAAPTIDGDGEKAEVEEEEDPDEVRGREIVEALEVTWSDVALFLAAEIVAKCRKAVSERLGYTCSAGIAPNKMLAKLCSAWKKPDAQTILRFSAVESFLRPMKFQKIRNLGGKLGNTIAEEYEAETVGDLLGVSVQELQRKMGEESGMWVWEIIRGVDFGEVEAKTQVKSMLSSKNFRPSISKLSEATHWLNILATELHLRLCEARDLSPGLWPKTITFTHRSPTYVSKSHQVPFPYTSRLNLAYVQRFADRLFKLAVDGGEKSKDGGKKVGGGRKDEVGPWSNVQLGLSGLERVEAGQEGIEMFFGPGVGAGVVSGAGGRDGEEEDDSLLPPPPPPTKKRKALDADTEETKPFPSLPSAVIKQPKLAPVVKKRKATPLPTASTSAPQASFTCPRCHIVLSAPLARLEKDKAEHEDYHFARDMLEEERKAQREEEGVGVKPVGVKGKGKGVKTGGGGVKVKGAGGAEGAKGGGGQQTLQGFFGKG